MALQRRVRPTVADGDDAGPPLWFELAVEVTRGATCPLAGPIDPATSGTVQLLGDTCHITMSRIEAGERREPRTHTTVIDDSCVCPAFVRGDCVSSALAVENGVLKAGAYADSRESLNDVMDRVHQVAATVRLERLTTASGTREDREGRPEPTTAVTLTEKQREAVRTAVDMGYYDRPREASLGDLADRLGVTRSALSQRLNAVEAKLITALATEL
ncbi:MAG: helix-turn-helix domain-containing protein [Halanaeroarchaeum sp.]